MLGKLEDMTITSMMSQLATAYHNRNYQEIKEHAHSLKGASAYIGAGRIHYACYFIQEHFTFERWDLQMAYYPTLIEAVVEF
jgi:HPt (histidine-containing phosphotransfer) domain-containing protein